MVIGSLIYWNLEEKSLFGILNLLSVPVSWHKSQISLHDSTAQMFLKWGALRSAWSKWIEVLFKPLQGNLIPAITKLLCHFFSSDQVLRIIPTNEQEVRSLKGILGLMKVCDHLSSHTCSLVRSVSCMLDGTCIAPSIIIIIIKISKISVFFCLGVF